MAMRRRDFLKGAAAGGLLLAAADPAQARQPRKELPPKAVGILYDSTLCIGCKACVHACKQANNMPPVHRPGEEPLWDNPDDLSSRTLNIIKRYGEDGAKDTEGGFAFIKRHCMHCIDPACVSCCPASALTKNPETGVVTYNKKACIGCRYCQIACPYNIPKFQWESPFPEIVKCQLCSHLLTKGEISACCNVCPTGASLFGPVEQLRAEAKRRLGMKAGEYHEFPVGRIDGGQTQQHQAGAYVEHVYGEHELGGTQVLYLAGVPFSRLGLPELPADSYVALADGIQYAIYKGMVYPLVVLGGLIYIIRNREEHKE
ncbi:MAG: hydrogenase 2 operon protein HybA [Thermodesulfobacteriota bacterium]